MSMSTFSRWASLATLLASGHAHSDSRLDWVASDVDLPSAASDMSATLVGDSIVMIGGCVSDNKRVVLDDGSFEFFTCPKITAVGTALDLETESFSFLPDAPTPRHRHAAVHDTDANHLWLIGGREEGRDGGVIASVDVLDLNSGAYLPPSLSFALEDAVSDHGAFYSPASKSIYVVGGYDREYDALSRVVAFDPARALATGTIALTPAASMAEARGDIHAVHFRREGKEYAAVTGGFTHLDGWCNPLKTAELFDVSDNSWSSLPDLQVGRGDKALVVANDDDNTIFALGGESKTDCSLDPAQATSPVKDVETLGFGDSEWDSAPALPGDRFRFQAVAYRDLVYTLGGQKFYDPVCDCYRVTNEIVVYREVEVDHDHDDRDRGLSNGALAGIIVGSVIGSAVIVMVAWKLFGHKGMDPPPPEAEKNVGDEQPADGVL